jgi:cytochrome o ubiquinol oxidase subunit 3
MSAAETAAELNRRQENDSKAMFGFWVYLMTDCVLFASLFATFAVLRNSTWGGPAGNELFSLPFVLTETIILLTSSFTAGLALLAARRRNKNQVLLFFGITFILGLFFLTMEVSEFHKLYAEGDSWRRSGFLSAFFTLVGTHGLHILTGLIWMATLMFGIAKHGITGPFYRRIGMLSLFWHFLDIIWIFIFTIVYLFGVAV